jgi:hypothetical protein
MLVVVAAAISGIAAAAAASADFDLQAHRGGRGETTEEFVITSLCATTWS